MWDSGVRINLESRREINNLMILVYKSNNPSTFQPPRKPKDSKVQHLFWDEGLKQLP